MFSIFSTQKKSTPSSKFSDFFVNSSASEKKKVFSKAARRANEEQRQLFEDRPLSKAK
jgi:hypothetical protein